MYYLILTMVAWGQDAAAGVASSSMQTLKFRDEPACQKAALAWKGSLVAARPKPENTRFRPAYVLSAVCVASDSTSRIK